MKLARHPAAISGPLIRNTIVSTIYPRTKDLSIRNWPERKHLVNSRFSNDLCSWYKWPCLWYLNIITAPINGIAVNVNAYRLKAFIGSFFFSSNEQYCCEYQCIQTSHSMVIFFLWNLLRICGYYMRHQILFCKYM